jgi:uncharacterized membrane protein (UPF0127 family)
MKPKKEKIIVGTSAVILAILIIFFVHNFFSITRTLSLPSTVWNGETPAVNLEWSLPGDTINLVIASTSVEQEFGLGDRASLASTSGMFFVFEKPDDYGFWMKGMEFSLDIIWLDQNFKIIHIEQDLSPSTYPQVFYPGSPAKYVIEVNAGTAAHFSLAIDQTMQIYQK